MVHQNGDVLERVNNMSLLSIATGGLNSTTDGVEFSTNQTPLSISTTTTRPNSDGHSLRINAGNGFVRQVLFTSNQITTGYIGVAIRIHSAVNANTQLIRWSNASNISVGFIQLTTSNTLALINSAGSQIGSASAALSLDTWYYVELKNDASTNPGALAGRLNGIVFASGSNSNQGQWARSLIGTITGTQTTSDIFFTDMKICDSTGSSFNSYPGNGNVLLVRPNGAGESTGWSIAGSSPAATNWQSVNEVPPDDAITLVNEALLSDIDLYTVASSGLHPYDRINAVAVGIRFNNDTADAISTFKVEIEKANGGTKLQSSAIVPNSTVWSTNQTQTVGTIAYPLVAYTDPDGAPWVGGGTLDTMRIGMISGTVGINKIQVTNLWAYIDYTPSTSPITTGLVSYWPMEGNSNDSIGGNNGTDTGMSYSSANGKILQGGSFNGSTSAIAIADVANLHLQNNLTLAVWFKTTTDYTGVTRGILAKDTQSGTRNLWRIAIGNSPGQVMFSTYDGTTFTSVTSASNYNDGNWHYAVATLTSAYLMTLYIDNVSVGTPVTGPTLTTFPTGEMDFGAMPPYIGAAPRADWFTGSIDEIGIWNRVLSTTEITQLYNNGNGLTYPFTNNNGLLMFI